MYIIKEFKEFALKGSGVEVAVGIVIGAAFGKIISSLVNDVIMPPIGLVLGGVDFNNLTIILKQATPGHPAVAIKYGQFVNNVIDFLIVLFAVFVVVKAINTLKREQE
jgi:large conductance mechanosensitive channel